MTRNQRTMPVREGTPAMRAMALRRLRMEQGLSMEQAGRRLRLSAGHVSRMEAGRRPPVSSEWIASAFGVPVEDVLGPCPHCRYRPPAGYLCLRCGSWTELAAG